VSDDKYATARNLPLLGVLSALGFTEWKPRKSGREWAGKCPVHQPKKNTSSFSFDVEGKYQCFSCSTKGKGAIDIVMAIKQIGFRDAVALLETLNVPEVPSGQAQNHVVHVDDMVTENPPFAGTYEKYAVPSPWLEARGLLPETLKQFEVFQYDNPKRKSQYTGSVMLTIRRWSDGEAVGYLSRNIGDITPESPKYRFPAGFQKSLELFGAWQIKNEVKQLPLRIAYLVESPLCVMKFAQLGLMAVSPFGFFVSPEQANVLPLLARGWIFVPDRNKFGEVAQSVSLIARHCWVKTPALPDGCDDPERLTREQIVALT